MMAEDGASDLVRLTYPRDSCRYIIDAYLRGVDFQLGVARLSWQELADLLTSVWVSGKED